MNTNEVDTKKYPEIKVLGKNNFTFFVELCSYNVKYDIILMR